MIKSTYDKVFFFLPTLSGFYLNFFFQVFAQLTAVLQGVLKFTALEPRCTSSRAFRGNRDNHSFCSPAFAQPALAQPASIDSVAFMPIVSTFFFSPCSSHPQIHWETLIISCADGPFFSLPFSIRRSPSPSPQKTFALFQTPWKGTPEDSTRKQV